MVRVLSYMLLALLAGWLVMSTDHGRAAVKGVRKRAKARGGSHSAKIRRPAPMGSTVGPALGHVARRAGVTLGRAGRAVFAAAGSAAQSRWAGREPPSRPIRRAATHDPPAESVTVPPTSDSQTDQEPQTPEAPSAPTAQEDTMAGTEYERPSSDGQFLEMVHQITQQIRADAAILQEAAGMLGQMGLASSVHGQFNTAAEHLLEAASAVHRAGVEFEAHYEEARTIAKRGMRFEGTEAA